MDITITGRHIAVTDDLTAYVEEKVARMLHRFGRELSVRATVGLEGAQHVVEVRVSAGHKHDFVAEARGEVLHATVDVAVDRLDRQLSKFKTKRQDRRRRPGTEAGVPASTADEEGEEEA